MERKGHTDETAKKKYENPKIEIINLGDEDIITSSQIDEGDVNNGNG